MDSGINSLIGNFNKICRTCMVEDEHLLPLQVILSDCDNTSIVDMLRTCTNVSFDENDGFPQNICVHCLRDLQQAYIFANKCKIVDFRFRSYLLEFHKLYFNQFLKDYVENQLKQTVAVIASDIMSSSSNFNSEALVPEIAPFDQQQNDTVEQNSEVEDSSQLSNCLTICEVESDNCDVSKCMADNLNSFEATEEAELVSSSISLEETRSLPLKKRYGKYSCKKCDLYFNTKDDQIDHKKSAHPKKLLTKKERDRKIAKSDSRTSNDENCDCVLTENKENENISEVPIDLTSENREIINIDFQGTKDVDKDNSEKLPNFVCMRCQEIFATKQDLYLHKRTHTKRRVLKVDRTFKINDLVCEHKFTLPPPERVLTESNRLKCSTCEKTFSTLGNLSRHQLSHTNIRPFSCKLCKKSFRDKQKLLRHIKIHAGIKPFGCHFCDKSFADKGDLIRHSRIHSGKKPFTCDICDKKFCLKGNLNNHRKLHDNTQPFQCNICFKKMNALCHLIIHKRIHTGERPYVCDICNRAFIQKGSLKRHMSVHSKN